MRHLADPAALTPGVASWLFLLVVLVLVPGAVVAQERQLRAMAATGVTLRRREVYASALVTHAVLLAIALLAAWQSGVILFPAFDPSARDWAIGGAAVALGSVTLLDRVSPAGARERAEAIAPQTPGELAAFAGVALSAGVVEEIVYRGVLFSLLASLTGGWWLPAVFGALAFGVAHAFQGWRAAALASAAGLVAQIVVGLTGTLVVAIAAHILHDLIAGAVIGRRARQRPPGADPVAV